MTEHFITSLLNLRTPLTASPPKSSLCSKNLEGSYSIKKINPNSFKCRSLQNQCFEPRGKICIVKQNTLILSFLLPSHSHFLYCVFILAFPLQFYCMWTEAKLQKPQSKFNNELGPALLLPQRHELVCSRDTEKVKYFLKLLPPIMLQCDKNTSLKYKDYI